MTNKKQKNLLKSNKKRQAVDTLRGYLYQIWHSVHAWLELSDEEILFLEGAEDFDIIEPGKGTAVQVKDTAANITLRSPAVIDAIAHYWDLFNDHPDRVIRFKFLTRSQIGIEKGQPFGSGIAGLILWQHCSRQIEEVEKLRNFLLTKVRLPKNLQQFLSDSDNKTIQTKLILPITWQTGSQDSSYIEQAIARKLTLHGDKYGIPPSKSASVVNRLLKETLTKVSHKSDRWLDRALFLRIFEEETTERIPTYQLQALKKAVSAVNPFLSAFLGSASGIALRFTSPIQNAVPPLPKSISPREKVIPSICSRLNEHGILILTGSIGMGKTILAKLIARKEGGNWYWLNASSRDSAQLSGILTHLALLLEHELIPINIVLDDLDLSPAYSRDYEDYLGGICYTLLARKGRMIITSQKSLPERLTRQLELNLQSSYSVPSMDEDEITAFSQTLGCTDIELARNWAKVVNMQTRGHPQLVHARLLSLSNSGWPPLRPDDLLQIPPDVTRERSETRDLLIKYLPENERELIYRLSVIAGLFRRDHAIAIGETNPSVKHPGDAFDLSIGPWIEHVYKEYYRLSPLLDNAADQVWSRGKVQSFHADIARAILKCGNLSSLEAGAILWHAWIGRDGYTLAFSIQGVLTSPEEVLESVLHELWWLKYIGLKPTQSPFPENIAVNFMLRMLQFRITLQNDPETAAQIAEAWDKEAVPHDPKEAFLLERYLLCANIVMHYKVKVSPRKLLAYLVEMSELEAQIEELPEFSGDSGSLRPAAIAPGSSDRITIFFSFVVPRCSSVEFLDELLDALGETPELVRNRMLAVFQTMELQASLLIDAVWLSVANSDKKDWELSIRLFERTIRLAMQWNAPSLAIAATRGLAIVYDEYLNDPAQAIVILDKFRALIAKPSLILDDEKAKVFFRQKRYKDALEIWEKILSEWHPPTEHHDMMPMFACRNAGISAAQIDGGNWRKAACFFKDGSKRSQQLKNQVFTIAFIADAGFALWKASAYQESINLFVETLKGLEKLPDPEKDLASFTLKKMVGHVLLWIKHSLAEKSTQDITEPIPGMCSNPERTEEIRELPDTPLDFFWMQLSKIEYHLRLGPSIFKRTYKRLIKSRFPTVRFFMAHLDIKHSFRRLEFDLLPVQIDVLDAAYQATREHYVRGEEVFEEAPLSIEDKHLPNFQMGETGLFFSSLVALAGADKIVPTLFKKWRKKMKSIPRNKTLTEWINLAELMLSREIREAYAIMSDGNQYPDNRLVCSLKVGTAEDTTPNEMFYAHTLLASHLLQGPWAEDVADYLAMLLSKQWLKKTEFQAVLISPRFTVPEIEKACKSEVGGAQKIAEILFAVSNAVSISMPQNIRVQLQNLIAN